MLKFIIIIIIIIIIVVVIIIIIIIRLLEVYFRFDQQYYDRRQLSTYS